MARKNKNQDEGNVSRADGAEALRVFMECSAKSTDKLHRFRYINPLMVEDSARVVFQSAQRIIEYERYLDYLEKRKDRIGNLPSRVEDHVGRSIQGVLLDVRMFAATALDLLGQVEEFRIFDQLVPEMAQCLERSGPVKAGDAINYMRNDVAGLAKQYGLSQDLLNWALQYVDVKELEVSASGDRIRRHGLGEELLLTTKNPTPLGIVDSIRFAYGQGYRRYIPNPNAYEGKAAMVSPYGCVIVMLRALLENYENRAFMTGLNGVQVLPTGVALWVILAVVGVILVIAGVVIAINCATGNMKGTVCELSSTAIIIGALLVCLSGVITQCAVSDGEDEVDLPPIDDPEG